VVEKEQFQSLNGDLPAENKAEVNLQYAVNMVLGQQ
jgi:hypothetical protein